MASGATSSGIDLLIAVNTNVAGYILQFNGAGNTTISGVVSGPGSLTMNGAGTLTLTNTNTYTGGATLAAGTLSLGSSECLARRGRSSSRAARCNLPPTTRPTTRARFSSSSTNYSINLNGQTVVFAALTGGSLTVSGTGTGDLALTATNTYSGGTTISAGVAVHRQRRHDGQHYRECCRQ